MADTMVRTNVYLRPLQKTRLTAAARRSETSEAALIRLAVDRMLEDPPPARRRPQTGFITAPPFVHLIDEILAEGFGQ
ncbi:MAG: CopG family transcriptional regulator [Mycobacteriales bacterium]